MKFVQKYVIYPYLNYDWCREANKKKKLQKSAKIHLDLHSII